MKINSLRYVLAALVAACSVYSDAQRHETVLSDGWRFARIENDGGSAAALSGTSGLKWQSVRVPHDWAIGGPFDKEIDKQTVAIVQNGEKEATEKTGRSGSLPWIGEGVYATTIQVAPSTERALLNFDGAMAEPEVLVNGQKAGEWKYGYTPFNIDITPFLDKRTVNQEVVVRLKNVEESSRWYPGAGLYRPVTLITTAKTALKEWSVEMNTLDVEHGCALVEFKAEVVGAEAGKTYLVEYAFAKNRRDSIKYCLSVLDGKVHSYDKVIGITTWSPEWPKLYDLQVSLYEQWQESDGKITRKLLDQMTKKIGFRTVECSADGGFKLNGKTRKIKGVCLHHDLGMLGVAVNKAALVRQIELLKSMGCNAIRTAHNIPSQMQMDVCDSLGMMVMAESFDMWAYPKCKNGYARFFNEWSDRDIENLVCAHRLHPSIVMWSVGNEIPEQGTKDGAKMLRHLQDVVHRFDKTRPITNGMDRLENALNTGFANVAEVPGMNYRTHLYEKAHQSLGCGFVLGSETASTVSSRGVYKFPAVRADGKAYADGQCSSYDLEACWWSNIPEEDWLLQDDRDWVIGEFVWTGFDYLGEPTPYDEYWPSRSSYFGIFDLAGLPKDRYYLYRSRWNSDEETIHLLPHWTWPGREGETIPVYCYTNYPTAELFVNGKSQGKITKRTDVKSGAGKNGRIEKADDPAIDRYRLRWNDVRYEPGELKVVVYDADGREVGTRSVHTAGKAAAILLTGDLGAPVKSLRADGDDMTFITVNIVDKDGNLVPDADNQLSVSVSGAAVFKGICNGDATSLEVFTKPTMRAFHGQLVVGIQSTGQQGRAVVKVAGKGLKSATVVIDAKNGISHKNKGREVRALREVTVF